MTSSSSPGISLKQEGISYLSGAEIPAVVVNIMRGGPGLGNIAGSQADYFQATRGGGNGDYQTVVLAPDSVQEMADLTVQAFDLADEYRIVVVLLGDGYLGQMAEGLVLPQPTGRTFDKSSWTLTGAKGREPRKLASLRLNPESALEEVNLRLQAKYRLIERKEPRFREYRCEDAEVLLTGFGTSARICRAAVNALRQEGVRAGLFRPITLWPFPDQALREAARQARRVLVVEMNAGQMLLDVRLALGGVHVAGGREIPVDFYGRMGGLVPGTEEIVARVKSYEK
jgi:2-oxoglutarate ferredoxin oxidoreductase subunit alpha